MDRALAGKHQPADDPTCGRERRLRARHGDDHVALGFVSSMK
jgi:hypothetical protein